MNKNKQPNNGGQGNDISPLEKRLLDQSGELTADDENLLRSALDATDTDGELLNEGSSTLNESGSDLDVPGTELDDRDEEIGEEDEENNSYSEADTE